MSSVIARTPATASSFPERLTIVLRSLYWLSPPIVFIALWSVYLSDPPVQQEAVSPEHFLVVVVALMGVYMLVANAVLASVRFLIAPDLIAKQREARKMRVADQLPLTTKELLMWGAIVLGLGGGGAIWWVMTL